MNIATKLLSDVYKDDIATVANVVCAQADKDYETIYNQIKALKNEIIKIERIKSWKQKIGQLMLTSFAKVWTTVVSVLIWLFSE